MYPVQYPVEWNIFSSSSSISTEGGHISERHSIWRVSIFVINHHAGNELALPYRIWSRLLLLNLIFFKYFQIEELGKTEVHGEKNCYNVTLATENPTWIGQESSLNLSVEKPATTLLCKSTAFLRFVIHLNHISRFISYLKENFVLMDYFCLRQ
jgi:hypothetical protein